MVLSDGQIKRMVKEAKMIEPFFDKHLGPTGYDLTLDRVFRIPVLDAEEQIIDPFNPPVYQEVIKEESIVIPSGSFVLGVSVERLRMPRDIVGVCLGRSTYARAAVITNVTPLEAGWEGRVTIEISNTNTLPVRVWVGRGIVQVQFHQADAIPEKDYAQKGGRYQFQEVLTQGRPGL